MAPLKESVDDSVKSLLGLFLQWVLPIGLVLITALLLLQGRNDRFVAGALVLTIPAVVAAVGWRAMRSPARGDDGPDLGPDALGLVLAGLAFTGVVVLVLVLRFADASRLTILAGFGLAYMSGMMAVLLGRRASTYWWAGGAMALLSVLYMLSTTTTKGYYFGATDLMAFFPSLERLIVTGDLDSALGSSSYNHIPMYFLFGAGGSFALDGTPVRTLFQLFAAFYPVMGLALVAMMRRLGMAERLAWIAFGLALISRPFLLESAYPTPRSLAVVLIVALLMVACILALEPKIATVPMVVVLLLLGIGLAFVHKVSGFMAVGPLLILFALSSLFIPRVEPRVRRVLLWSLGFILVLHVTNALFITRYLREALELLTAVETAAPSDNIAIVRWEWSDTANFVLDNLGPLLLMVLVLGGCLALLRRPEEHRIRNAGVVLLAYLAMQVALLSPLYSFRFFTTTTSITRLAPVAFLVCAIPAAFALLGLALGRQGRPVQPARIALAAVAIVLLVGASFSAGMVNQDLAFNRRANQYTNSFSEPEVAALKFGEDFTGSVMADRLAWRYYTANPFTGTTYDRVYDRQVPPKDNAGFVLVRYPEYEAGYTQATVLVDDFDGVPRYATRVTTETPAYAEFVDGLQSSGAIVYDSGGYVWYRYLAPEDA